MKPLRCLFLLFPLFLTIGCASSKYIQSELQKTEKQRQDHIGFLLYDPKTQKKLVAWQDDRYFNPASNTKIYTLYASLKALKDSLPGLQYQLLRDTLYIRGTGDPSLFHPDLPASAVAAFLATTPYPIVYAGNHFTDRRNGPGWAWDDYNDYYQTEKSALPVYGNIVRFSRDSANGLRASPAFWQSALQPGAHPGIYREIHRNIFHYPENNPPARDIPVIVSDSLTLRLLGYALGKTIGYTPNRLTGPVVTQYSLPADTVYRRMMYKSDNMLAEHLLYLYASVNGLELNSRAAIAHALAHHFQGMPDTLVWKDGSGLSRYNLFTPRTTVAVLERLLETVPEKRLLSYFPTVGSTVFKERKPRIYAKSGSFSNNYTLSGYLYTRKGRLLVFSYMNNHFIRPMSEIRQDTEKLLLKIYEKY